VQLGLDRLTRQGIVAAAPAGRAILYRLNVDHLAAPHIQALIQLRRELLQRLRADFQNWVPAPAAAYLYGSTARRESTAESDIDLLVVRPRDVDADAAAWRSQIDRLSRMVTVWTGNEAQVLEFSEDEARTLAGRDALFVSIHGDGILLAGDDGLLRPE
jgi:predicted nucleotidyltransferase